MTRSRDDWKHPHTRVLVVTWIAFVVLLLEFFTHPGRGLAMAALVAFVLMVINGFVWMWMVGSERHAVFEASRRSWVDYCGRMNTYGREP